MLVTKFLNFLNCTISNHIIVYLLMAKNIYYNKLLITRYTIILLKANITFLYPLKILENLWFSDIFRGCRNGTLA